MTISRAQTRRNYDRLSGWYDLLAGASERACREVGLDLLDVQPGERVLEIGSGTGHALESLSRMAGLTGGAWGVDLSLGMCRVAAKRLGLADLGRSPPGLVCGDAAALPVKDAGFDAVFMSFTLELVGTEEMGRVLGECARVLRGGGRIGVVALAETEEPGVMQRLYVAAHGRFPAWVDCRPIPLVSILRAHGFEPRRTVRRAMWGLPVEVVVADNAG